MLYRRRDLWWAYTGKLRDLLYCIFFFFMPFTQALTFSVGFPLKFSELALFILAFLYLVMDRRVKIPRPVIFILSFFFLVISISVAINLFAHYPYPLRDFETRFGYKGDTIARYIYFILAILSFFVSIDIFLTDRTRYIRIWTYGAVAAAIYSWYLCIFSFLHLPVFLLPGMSHPPQAILAFNRLIIRCGTFLEGNIMGLYLLISGALCFYIKRYKTGLFLFIAVFSTFSTLSILSAFGFLIIYLQRFIFQRKNLKYFIPIAATMAILLFFFSKTVVYKQYVYAKLFAKTDKVNDVSAYSKTDRLFSIKDAYAMGRSNPVLGVGLSNYARHYGQYMDRTGFDPDFIKTLIRPDYKVIPNNIYLEIWAESGGIAFLLFASLLILLFYYAWKSDSKALLPAMICLVVCFNAYPSFIMIYFWSFMALPVADYIINKKPANSAVG